MANLKLKIAKVANVQPQSKQKGFTARVITNGTASLDEVSAEACRNTTLHKAEAKIALELCMEAVAEKLKQGMIVDLGPVGKLYPSCQSTWVADAADLKLESVKPSLYYRAADDVAGAIKGASLVWAKAEDEDEEENGGGSETPSGGGSETPSGGGGGTTTGGDEPGEDRP